MRSSQILLPLLVAGCAGSVDGQAPRPPVEASPDDSATSDTQGAPISSDTGSTEAPDTAAPGPEPLPFRELPAMRIKSIQPDFWANHDEISGNAAGGVSFNLVWSMWEPESQLAPCAVGQEAYDGHCFTIDAAVDADILDYTARGLNVTAVVYGVPAWARIPGCVPASPGFEIFCAPVDAADYARFAGMLARRYDGLHGHGRVSAFVIHNEVNSNTWFDVGCGQGTPCDEQLWLDTYAASYLAAYDAIVAEQLHARVLVSLDHHFGADFDDPTAPAPLLSGETVLRHIAAAAGARDWRVAYHPYPPDLLANEFSPDDWPRVTYGNLGALAGWLHREFPGSAAAEDIHLTESGVNSVAPGSSLQDQSDALCDAMRNVLGTPGVDDHVYHRLVDHPVEVAGGLALGLRDELGNAKPAWSIWALANRDDLVPPLLDCGFEHLPHVRLVRSYSTERGHWASTRVAPAGFTEESAWLLDREASAGTVLLFECAFGTHGFLTDDPACEGQQPLGPVGWAYTSALPNTVAIHRCYTGVDHFISTDPGCEGQVFERTLGWAHPG